ncbi:CopG family ribbon-helix-helix protein [Hyperthermus butylicus]|uniref:Nickel responsive regulator n=1 Tax=Hyperthermus butylicus (strain DSM 5456 / JCM 9403 / PLM1-5) TaxID=415426 RepID=A2BJB5_HYPBU|nr:CopG family ribbon-helix-helix protein [Hyperthermus butylicus]ABM80076.1 Nickel responsive regulator [Hyperthermus butylicus DSM 5456]
MAVISISLPNNLLDKVDEYIEKYGYTSRSELIREALREYLSQRFPQETFTGKIYAIVVILTNHEIKPSVDQKVINTIHSFQTIIKSFYHQLLEGSWCLNIAVVESTWNEIQALVKALRKIQGIDRIWFIPLRIEQGS